MKKTLVFVLVAAMLVSMLSVSTSAYFAKAANSGNVKINTYVAKTAWTPDGVIDTANGEYYEVPLTKGDVSYMYRGTGYSDTDPDAAAEILMDQQIATLKFYSSWSGANMLYLAATWKPIKLMQTMSSYYTPADGKGLGNVGAGDDWANNLAIVINSCGDIHKEAKSPFVTTTNGNWLYMAYGRALEDGVINPDGMPFDGMFAGSYSGQRGVYDTYNPLGGQDFYVGYDLEAGTCTFEISLPTGDTWGKTTVQNGDVCYINFEMLCGMEEYSNSWSGPNYAMCLGDFGFFLPGPGYNDEGNPNPGCGNNSAAVVFLDGQPEGWGAEEPADDETTAADDETTVADDETTVADDTTAEDTTAEETTKKQETPVNPKTADITVLCLAAAASAIAVISKKRK